MNLFGGPGKEERLLAWAKVCICAIIACGFLAISLFNHRHSQEMLRNDAEHISMLTSERIRNRVTHILAEPINTSMAMATDQFLKSTLEREREGAPGDDVERVIYEYLKGYKDTYGYAAVFLASSQSSRYYNSSTGLDRYLNGGDADDSWYYSFIHKPVNYEVNIDHDFSRYAGRQLEVFVNAKVYSSQGSRRLLGVVGTAIALSDLQAVFGDYDEGNSLRAYLIDTSGIIELSSDRTQLAHQSLFDDPDLAPYRDRILGNYSLEQLSWWYGGGTHHGFLTAMYIPMLQWHLVVDHDTSALEVAVWQQLAVGVIGIIVITCVVMLLVSLVIKWYNRQIVAVTGESVRWQILQKESAKMYEGVYEVDLTNDRVLSDSGLRYIADAGWEAGIGYDDAIKHIARTRVRKEYRKGYVDRLLRANVMREYDAGRDHLAYEFQSTRDGGATYRWTRLTARVFPWTSDGTLHMLLYNQNISEEKQREAYMEQSMRHDALSRLYNKATTQEMGKQLLHNAGIRPYAFIIIDIDSFKSVNDTYGHAVGDEVIADFAQRIQSLFRQGDIVGRIGGDEFAVIIRADNYQDWLRDKLRALVETLCYEHDAGGGRAVRLTASIGAAISPMSGDDFDSLYRSADKALYETKRRGKNGYTLWQDPPL